VPWAPQRCSSHDQHEALGLSDRVAVMSHGRIEQLGTPEDVYERPATAFVADFVGASSVLTARAASSHLVEIAGARIAVRLPRPLATGETVHLVIRPERIAFGPPGPNMVAARVTGVMYLGDHSEVRIELLDGTRLLASVHGRAAMSIGERVHARLPEDAFLEAR
jgi:ABC-type Fe3+/spermidine/putrescine transport system ATPase subunit